MQSVDDSRANYASHDATARRLRSDPASCSEKGRKKFVMFIYFSVCRSNLSKHAYFRHIFVRLALIKFMMAARFSEDEDFGCLNRSTEL